MCRHHRSDRSPWRDPAAGAVRLLGKSKRCARDTPAETTDPLRRRPKHQPARHKPAPNSEGGVPVANSGTRPQPHQPASRNSGMSPRPSIFLELRAQAPLSRADPSRLALVALTAWLGPVGVKEAYARLVGRRARHPG